MDELDSQDTESEKYGCDIENVLGAGMSGLKTCVTGSPCEEVLARVRILDRDSSCFVNIQP